jgi:hypothetical protein
MFDISFETDDDKWKWGGVLGGIGVALVATGVMAGCLCRNCLRRRAELRAASLVYKDKLKQTQLCVDGVSSEGRFQKPSAPPYDDSNAL